MNKISLNLGKRVAEIMITPRERPKHHPEPESQREEAQMKELVEQAFKEGVQEGLAAGRKHVETLKACMEHKLEQLDNQWQEVLEQLRPNLLSLILHIVERLLLENVDAGNYHIEGIVKKVTDELAMVSGLEIVEIHCNSEDIAALSDEKTAFKLLPDSRVAKGDCVVKTDIGRVVVSLKERLEQLRKIFGR